jgi:hypothetical protein
VDVFSHSNHQRPGRPPVVLHHAEPPWTSVRPGHAVAPGRECESWLRTSLASQPSPQQAHLCAASNSVGCARTARPCRGPRPASRPGRDGTVPPLRPFMAAVRNGHSARGAGAGRAGVAGSSKGSAHADVLSWVDVCGDPRSWPDSCRSGHSWSNSAIPMQSGCVMVVNGEGLAIVIDLVDGQDLFSLLGARTPRPALACTVAAQITEGLAAAYAFGLGASRLGPRADLTPATLVKPGRCRPSRP